jgi:hypothetical protein
LREQFHSSGGSGNPEGPRIFGRRPFVVLQLPRSRARGGLLQLGCNSNLKAFDPML